MTEISHMQRLFLNVKKINIEIIDLLNLIKKTEEIERIISRREIGIEK